MTIEPRTTSQAGSASSSSGLLGGDSSMFMQLLMAQLQAQDPMSPMDTNSFVTQLVQFNTLNEVTQIKDLIQSMGASTPAGS